MFQKIIRVAHLVLHPSALQDNLFDIETKLLLFCHGKRNAPWIPCHANLLRWPKLAYASLFAKNFETTMDICPLTPLPSSFMMDFCLAFLLDEVPQTEFATKANASRDGEHAKL